MGRPVEWTESRIAWWAAKVKRYTSETDIPIVAEFAYQNGILRQTLYEHEGFSDAIKGLIAKKEANLERLALEGTVDKSMAIFSLKQLGWSDKREIEHFGTVVERVYRLTDADDSRTDPDVAEAAEADIEPTQIHRSDRRGGERQDAGRRDTGHV